MTAVMGDDVSKIHTFDVQELLLGAVAKIDDRQTGSCYLLVMFEC